MSGRNCARCGKELDDAASLEVGIGPICRRLDNAVLASRIPADLEVARAAFRLTDKEVLPEECWATYRKVCGALNGPPRKEWREVVKGIEWILSWIGSNPVTGEDVVRQAFYACVEGLGYIGIVSLWRGEAASGKAKVWFDTTRTWTRRDGSHVTEKGAFIFVAGPRNRSAIDALRAIEGRRFHDKASLGGERAAWSVPATDAGCENVKKAVLRHYPNHEVDGGWDAFLKKAQAEGAKVAKEEAAKPKEPLCKITEAGDWLLVKSPYHPEFVRDLKALPYADRKWSPTFTAWQVKKEHEARVRGLVARYYGGAALKDVAA